MSRYQDPTDPVLRIYGSIGPWSFYPLVPTGTYQQYWWLRATLVAGFLKSRYIQDLEKERPHLISLYQRYL